MAETKLGKAINLLPRLTKREVEVVEKKVNFSLSGAIFLVFMVGAAVIILALNLFFKNQLASAEGSLAGTETRIASYSGIESQARTLAFKLSTYQGIRGVLFKQAEVVGNLESLAPADVEIRVFAMGTESDAFAGTSELEYFRVSGVADSIETISTYAYALESQPEKYEQVRIALVQKRTEEEMEAEGKLDDMNLGEDEEIPIEYNFTILFLVKNVYETQSAES